MEMKEGNVMPDKGLFLMVDQRMCGGSGLKSYNPSWDLVTISLSHVFSFWISNSFMM